jgi:carbonic anhydrase
MAELDDLLERNRRWSEALRAQDPDFFKRLSEQQAPKYLWIGCSDSRVPANQIIGMDPGEVFVHRNVANVVVHTDLNCISAIQFAVDVLKVEHILVVGHYGCGGVQAVLEDRRLGLVDNWLRHVADVRQKHVDSLRQVADPRTRHARLCELNVIEQAVNVLPHDGRAGRLGARPEAQRARLDLQPAQRSRARPRARREGHLTGRGATGTGPGLARTDLRARRRIDGGLDHVHLRKRSGTGTRDAAVAGATAADRQRLDHPSSARR